MAGSWNANINFIQNGERVDANVSGRPDRSLSDRTEYLKQRIDALDNGQALFAFDVAVAADVVVGNAVYWNVTSQRFEKALAAVTQDEAGLIINSPAAEVIGIVHSKTSSTVASLVLAGKVTMDISLAASATVSAGRYYLSGVEAGKLVNQSSSISVPVLYHDGNSTVYVLPQSKRLFDNHNHYKIELNTDAAGTVNTPGPGESYEITNPDDSLPGWLPSDHSSFNDLAPAGALFGYNLAQHEQLAALWPPIPEDSVSVIFFGGDQGFGQELPIGPNGFVVIDINGIWWMSNCYGYAPWDINIYDQVPSVLNNSSSCTLPSPGNALVLYFSKVRYCAGVSVVTSLRAYPDNSPLLVTDLDGNTATSGDLRIKFDSDFMVSPTADDVTTTAFKSLNGTTFTKGLVVGGIKAANDTVSLVSTNSRISGGDTIHQGIVTIEANLDGVERIIVPQVVRVIDVRERYENEITYLGFPAGIEASVRYKFRLPSAGTFPTNPKLKLRLWLTGDVTTTGFPNLTVSYRRVARPIAATAIPTTDTYLNLTTGMALTTDYYIEKTSEVFTVAENDVVFFTITRSSSDGYLGEIGIIDAVAVLSPG
jgi:hypothetical protein